MIRALFLVLTLAPAMALAGNCKVIDVSDGDTFTCLTGTNEQVKVRLAEIDAPEMNQPYGDRSKQSLSLLILSEMVKMDVQDTDDYGRTVARITRTDGVDVNAEQVRSGAAWVYPRYLKDQSLLDLQTEAKNYPRGLWTLPTADQVPPWEWRHAGQAASTPEAPASVQPKRQATFSQFDSPSAGHTGGGYNCNVLKWCGQMSCAEARYQLTTCGNPNIDGDRDGRPCERQCN